MFEFLHVDQGPEHPSLVSRVVLLEDAVRRILRGQDKMFWVGIGIIAAVIGQVIDHHVFGGH